MDLPVVIQSVRGVPLDQQLAALAGQRARYQRLLHEAGALLLRGLTVGGASAFRRVITLFGEGRSLPYIGGDSPRHRVTESVYTSTEVPARIRIPLHGEMSYLPSWPRQLWFYCEHPAERGGETTLADARAVFSDLDPSVRRRFVERGVRYVCSYGGTGGVVARLQRRLKTARSWLEVFDTQDRAVAEARCRELGLTSEWLAKGGLLTSGVRPASATHPVTRETVWFNQAHVFRLSPETIGRVHYGLSRLLANHHDARYGDGGEIEPAALDHVHEVLERRERRFTWQRDDVLIVDNLLCMHGRNPYRGNRRVLVALTD